MLGSPNNRSTRGRDYEQCIEWAMEAFLEALEPRDTLLTPAFTFCHKAEEDPIIDPCRDPSKMGAITEALRQHLQALRSTAVDENIFRSEGGQDSTTALIFGTKTQSSEMMDGAGGTLRVVRPRRRQAGAAECPVAEIG